MATFRSSPGRWNGMGPTVYTYQWLRDGLAISGATASSYTTVEADEGTELACQVTATNVDGVGVGTSSAVVIPGSQLLTEAGDFLTTEDGFSLEYTEAA